VARGRLLQTLELGAYRLFAGRIRGATDAGIERWGARVGWIAPRLLRKRHALAVRNIALTFPEKSPSEIEAIARASWRHFATMFLTSIRAHGESVPEIGRRMQIDRRHFDEAMAAGKGLILLSAHFGYWEIGSNLLPLAERRVTTVARLLDNPRLDEELLRGRRRENVQIVDRRGAARPLAATLRDGGVVVLLVDQHVLPREGVRVPFLGRPAWTSTAPARLMLSFGSPILCVFCYRDRVDFEPPIFPAAVAAEQQNVESITTQLNEIISARIRRDPELWFWMHNRWK
jgi:lauroyl/myristoyl acyltransferase